MVLHPKPTLQGCYQVLKKCELEYFCSVITSDPPVNLQILPESDVDLIVLLTAPHTARVGVRGSAPARRGAAAYGDAS